jgi:hypothetical protein
MPKIVTIEALYHGDPDEMFEAALDLDEMRAAMAEIAQYDGLPSGKIKQSQTITVDVTMLGMMKTKGHVMRVEKLDRKKRLLQSRERNPDVKRWDHTLTIEPHGDGSLWRDRIVLDAGMKTWVTAFFCRYVYTHRHKVRNAYKITKNIEKGSN